MVFMMLYLRFKTRVILTMGVLCRGSITHCEKTVFKYYVSCTKENMHCTYIGFKKTTRFCEIIN